MISSENAISVAPKRSAWSPERANGKMDLCADNGAISADGIRALDRSIPREPEPPAIILHGPTPLHGICAADDSRAPEGYRRLSALAPQGIVPYAESRPGLAQYPLVCDLDTGLLPLRRLWLTTDRHCPRAVRERSLRRRTGQRGLRAGPEHNPDVALAVSLGAVSHRQDGGMDALAARLARQYHERYPCQLWQAARCQNPRSIDTGSRRFLLNGSWLQQLPAPLRAALRCILPSGRQPAEAALKTRGQA
jgi:hypothetical protein